MSRRHHVKHARTPGGYARRLRKRGETSASVRMEEVGVLRRRQGGREPAPASGFEEEVGT